MLRFGDGRRAVSFVDFDTGFGGGELRFEGEALFLIFAGEILEFILGLFDDGLSDGGIDFGASFGGVDEEGDVVGIDLDEPRAAGEDGGEIAIFDEDLPRFNGRKDRDVTGKDFHFPSGTGELDGIDLFPEDDALRRNDSDFESIGHLNLFTELFRFSDCFIDISDHMESGLGEIVIFAGEEGVEATNRVLNFDVFTGDTGEFFADEEGL